MKYLFTEPSTTSNYLGLSGKVERTGVLNKPLPILLKALAGLVADHWVGRLRFNAYIDETLRHYNASDSTFKHPGPDDDRLFDASYDHDPFYSSCSNCDPEELVIRKSRVSDSPVVHYGIIASGNQVMKHGQTRNRIAKELGDVLCFEMEAAGIMDSFPCIVIRGICDYCDSHKNKQWQGYAALCAAAYTKELLSHVPIMEISKHDRHGQHPRIQILSLYQKIYYVYEHMPGLLLPPLMLMCTSLMVHTYLFSTSNTDAIVSITLIILYGQAYWAIWKHSIARWKAYLWLFSVLALWYVYSWIVSAPLGVAFYVAQCFPLIPFLPQLITEGIY
ncbi:hypothetical protein BDV33DRAFT_208569 [Aspergillus novoparasiticus]|uniref:Nucleoside phosphorylase domain-containing protein n=1 Tax=Aspergillus novoparasiticus TaxID=986946 RepID=A0A5N6ED41_9EURO|nr:hypothetical protein BDV33DRAFT_208569 [Aspergillus novoparasiticus]